MLQSKGLLEIPSDKFNFLWVVDFPLFSLEPDLCSTHHPFTGLLVLALRCLFSAPYTEDIPLLDSKDQDDLLKIRALHYDIVCNGVELGTNKFKYFSDERWWIDSYSRSPDAT
jgi:aspartyl-tRNA synthetase